MASDSVLINTEALRAHLKKQNAKAWWVAENAGIAPKTLQRWVNGKSKRALVENVEALAQSLNCDSSSLILTEDSGFGQESDQLEAASLIYDSPFFAFINRNCRWSLLEKLVRGIFRPNTPIQKTAELQHSLALANLHLWNLKKALLHASKAEEIAQQIQNTYLVTASNLIRGCALSLLGEYKQSQATLENCLKSYRELDKSVEVAGTLSVLGFNSYMAGDLKTARSFSAAAIEEGQKANSHQFESIGYMCLGSILWQEKKYLESKRDFTIARDIADRGSFLKEKFYATLCLAYVAEVEGDRVLCDSLFKEGTTGFSKLETFNDSLEEVVGGMIAEARGDYQRAEMLYKYGSTAKNSAFVKKLLSEKLMSVRVHLQ